MISFDFELDAVMTSLKYSSKWLELLWKHGNLFDCFNLFSGITLKSFNKYQESGAYHWDDLKKYTIKDLISRSVPTLTRYKKILNVVPKRKCRIVDIGCGDGALTYFLSNLSSTFF